MVGGPGEEEAVCVLGQLHAFPAVRRVEGVVWGASEKTPLCIVITINITIIVIVIVIVTVIVIVIIVWRASEKTQLCIVPLPSVFFPLSFVMSLQFSIFHSGKITAGWWVILKFSLFGHFGFNFSLLGHFGFKIFSFWTFWF